MTVKTQPSAADLRAARALRIKIHNLNGSEKCNSPFQPDNAKWLDSVCAEDAEIIAREMEPERRAMPDKEIVRRLNEEVAELRQDCIRLAEERREMLEALRKLANEARGFLGMANPDDHGVTNMRVLQERIEMADAAIAHTKGTK
jgi:hypothetical protein